MHQRQQKHAHNVHKFKIWDERMRGFNQWEEITPDSELAKLSKEEIDARIKELTKDISTLEGKPTFET